MVRLSLLLLIAVVALLSPFATSNPSAQCQIWCPAGDGQLLGGAPLGNRTVDFNINGTVSLPDLAFFAAGWPPQPYVLCRDLNNDGLIGLPDLALFASHWSHVGAGGALCN